MADSLTKLGEYVLLRELGRGGMGVVFLAEHQRLAKQVALKVLPPDRLTDELAIARFHREMKALGRLDHPHIVKAFDAGEQDGHCFLVLEYVDGADLNVVQQQNAPLSVPVACELIRQAALGLQHAHEHGLIHRDVKPSNLFLSRQGQVKVLDLGLARLSSTNSEQELTSTGQILGTIDYIAPEQFSDLHQIDARTDLYSLGATLYKLLTGDAPYADLASPLQKLRAHAEASIPDVTLKRPDVPPSLKAILEQLLAKDPAERFASAAELVGTLAQLCAGAQLYGLTGNPSRTKPNPPQLPHSPVTIRSPEKSGLSTSLNGSDWDSDPSAPTEIQSSPVPRRRSSVVAGIAAGLLTCIVLTGVVFNLQSVRQEALQPTPHETPHSPPAAAEMAKGTLVLVGETNPLEVTLTKGTGKDLRVLFYKVTDRMFELPPGEDYRLEVTDLENGTSYDSGLIQIETSREKAIEIAFELAVPQFQRALAKLAADVSGYTADPTGPKTICIRDIESPPGVIWPSRLKQLLTDQLTTRGIVVTEDSGEAQLELSMTASASPNVQNLFLLNLILRDSHQTELTVVRGTMIFGPVHRASLEFDRSVPTATRTMFSPLLERVAKQIAQFLSERDPEPVVAIREYSAPSALAGAHLLQDVLSIELGKLAVQVVDELDNPQWTIVGNMSVGGNLSELTLKVVIFDVNGSELHEFIWHFDPSQHQLDSPPPEPTPAMEPPVEQPVTWKNIVANLAQRVAKYHDERFEQAELIAVKQFSCPPALTLGDSLRETLIAELKLQGLKVVDEVDDPIWTLVGSISVATRGTQTVYFLKLTVFDNAGEELHEFNQELPPLTTDGAVSPDPSETPPPAN